MSGNKKQKMKLSHPIKKVALVYRIAKPEAVKLAEETASWFKKKGIQVFTAPNQRLLRGTKPLRPSNKRTNMDLVIVLGGDGSYLRAVRMFQTKSPPVLGFNMGSLGFLTSNHAEQCFAILDQVLRGQAWVEGRTMIEAITSAGTKQTALNDVVIERGGQSQLLNVSIYSDGDFVSSVKADGIIVSTPSGSTAYNLAAGGPIVETRAPVILVTPIAPHSLTSRPLIFSNSCKLRFKIENSTPLAQVVVDGQKLGSLSPRNYLDIRLSKNQHLALKTMDYDFFQLLREKLKFGDR